MFAGLGPEFLVRKPREYGRHEPLEADSGTVDAGLLFIHDLAHGIELRLEQLPVAIRQIRGEDLLARLLAIERHGFARQAGAIQLLVADGRIVDQRLVIGHDVSPGPQQFGEPRGHRCIIGIAGVRDAHHDDSQSDDRRTAGRSEAGAGM